MTTRFLAVALAAVHLGGCAILGGEEPPAAPSLRPPSASLMRAPKPLPDIPADEARPEVRRAYYATTRREYGDLADRHRALQRYVRELAK